MRWARATTPSGSTTTRGRTRVRPAAAGRHRAPPRGGAPVAAAAARAPEPADRRLRRAARLRARARIADRAERPRDAAHPAPRRADRRARRGGRRAACRSPAPTPAPGRWRRCSTTSRSTRPGAAPAPGRASRWSRRSTATSTPAPASSTGWRSSSAHPNRDPEMLELFYFCLALGFRGRYRVPGRAGARSLAAVRTAAARLLRDPEAAQAPLSPNWQGVVAADEPRRFAVPLWVLFAAAVVAAAAIYLAALAPARRAVRAARRPRPLAAAGRAGRDLPPAARHHAAAGAGGRGRSTSPSCPSFEAARPRGPAAGAERAARPSRSPRSSSSGPTPRSSARPQAELTDGFEPLIASIGQAIAANQDLIGNVTVVGHTDSIPVSGANPFDDNQGLSEARAATIARILVANGAPADRVRCRGPRRHRAGRLEQDPGGPRAEPPRRDPGREAALRWRVLPLPLGLPHLPLALDA